MSSFPAGQIIKHHNCPELTGPYTVIESILVPPLSGRRFYFWLGIAR
jgi:hypothetical protein